MTTDTVRQRLSPARPAVSRARAAARDTSTAARHAVLGLRIAGAAPVRWAVACALAVGRAIRRGIGGAGGALAGGLQATGRAIGRCVVRAARGGGRAVRNAAAAAGRGMASGARAPWRGVKAAGRGLARAGRGVRGAAGRGLRRLPVWWPVVVCTLLGALGGAAYGWFTAPEYTATSYVMVTSSDGSGGPAALGYAQAYGRIATGGAVLNQARTASLPLSALESGVEAVTSPDAPMIEITGTAGSPRHAADMANRVAKALTGIANLSSKDTGARLRVFSEALTPDAPASPSRPLSVAVGACTGGLIGALLLLVRPRRNRRRALEVVSVPTAAAPASTQETKRETTASAKKNTKEKV